MTGPGSLDEQRLRALEGTFSGDLLRPDATGYDEARRIYNGLIDKRPALIARPRGTADVASAIAFARESDLEISIRGGGHGVAGRAVADGALMIDLSSMKQVSVDPDARTARAGGGVTWGEFNDAAAEHALATTGGVVSTTGIAGLTLGGGLGWLMGKHGLAADNLVSVELVTAEGDVRTASAEQDPDLFWALRGAGANFGVATTLGYRLHRLAQVTGGLAAYSFDAARDVLAFYRDFTAELPDELTVYSGLIHAPDGSGMPLAAIVVCHAGQGSQAEIDLKPLLDFGSPAMVQIGPMPYPAINSMLNDGYPAGSLNYWKSSFLRELSDEAIQTIIDVFPSCPSPMTGLLFEHFHGAVTRVGVADTAVQHREPGYNLVMTSVWTDPLQNDANLRWTKQTYAALEPYFSDRRYLNYLSEDDLGQAARAAYGPNYDRLAQLKTRYDPENVFHLNLNLEPVA
ncbi:MAG: FAD-binding oxidoreductase [Actinomycetota bacterium]